MKIAIVSDTHGSINDVIEELKKYNIDVLIHLGDFADDGLDIGNSIDVPTYVVKGNNDYLATTFVEDELININGINILMTHGHRYGVYNGLNNLLQKAKVLNANIVLFGHTHVFKNEVIDDIWFINPGSPNYPRFGDDKSFVILDLDNMTLDRIKFRRSKWKLY